MTPIELKETLSTEEGKAFFLTQVNSMGKYALRQAVVELTGVVIDLSIENDRLEQLNTEEPEEQEA